VTRQIYSVPPTTFACSKDSENFGVAANLFKEGKPKKLEQIKNLRQHLEVRVQVCKSFIQEDNLKIRLDTELKTH